MIGRFKASIPIPNISQLYCKPHWPYVHNTTEPSDSACQATSDDPCNNYTALDNPWRATNTTTQLNICDRPFNWTGWYRMLYYGMNIRMPQSCVNEYRCGTDITLWLNDPHPQIVDGIVNCRVCGSSGSDCCASVSTPIRVKACPGSYYVYEFVKTTCSAAYCADVNTISPNIVPTTATITAVSNYAVFDPCNVYTVLDDEWRIMDGLAYTIYRGHDDTVAKWNGWYRLYLQGKSAQIPEPDWCANYIVCGGYTPLFLGGSHPQPQDGIVTREIYGSYGYVTDGRQCNSYRSNPIQVKACPGQFYVYRLVQPAVLFPRPTYCSVALDTPSNDPCNSYTSLDQPWRGTNATGGTNCDRSFNGDGWYRLLYNRMNIRMPESCVALSKCGTATSLWLNGSHPQMLDGIVALRVCGRSGTDCCYYRSTPVRVKACPGNYFVYEFFSTPFCDAAYCADVTTIMPISTTTAASSTKLTTRSDLYTTNVSAAMSIITTTLDVRSQLNRINVSTAMSIITTTLDVRSQLNRTRSK
ncbi:uromodulin-like [Pygocentrus nattereri]|uniref:uromodulin-like n=1 Tax=Pygocentrus nattereri TaxID=42514 RepID=UPI0018914794|nr:uromodulin-like [Pygocentrus nattereri]